MMDGSGSQTPPRPGVTGRLGAVVGMGIRWKRGLSGGLKRRA